MRFFENERELMRWVLVEARKRGWLACAFGAPFHVVRKAGGTVTIPNKDAIGFPDLALVHPEHGLVFVELKLDPKTRLRPEQAIWLAALAAAGQRVYVLRAHQQDAILDVLDGREPSERLSPSFPRAAA
jgi:hypothetical protein